MSVCVPVSGILHASIDCRVTPFGALAISSQWTLVSGQTVHTLHTNSTSPEAKKRRRVSPAALSQPCLVAMEKLRTLNYLIRID